MDPLAAYLPVDRRHALARGQDLPDRTSGTALFADISGFTPLTESLLNTLGPQRGAEELSRHLNAVFNAVIAEVDQYGGSVLAFSGDAITGWFDGQAGDRAATCALAMQAAMRPFASLTLSNGDQTALAMKVALASGPARRLVVGDPAIQYLDVLAGATLDRMAEAEHHAQGGEIVIDAATLRQLGPAARLGRKITTETGSFATLTALDPQGGEHPWPELPDQALAGEALRPWLLPPVFARLREGQAQFLAEIRPSVALFMSFGGIDYDADPLAGRKLDAYLWSVQQTLHRYEAFFLQLTLGDKGCYLYAAFGAPLAHDDDPLRAMEAAQALQALGGRFSYIRDVRIGLNEGRVWCGAYGGRTRHTYGALGDSVNVAARLMGHAKPGETLVSPSMLKAAEAHYVLDAVGTLKLKGKAEPLPVHRLGHSLALPPSPVRMTEHALFGREHELAWLTARWQTALGGKGQVARLTGARGIGKSHLVQEFARALVNEGARAGVGECHSAEQFAVYRPWRAVLLRLLEVRETALAPDELAKAAAESLCALNPAWTVRTPLLGDVLGCSLPENAMTAAMEPKLRREATWAMVVDMVRMLAERQPLLLWLDNVHNLDEASRALTLEVSRAIESSPVMLLCTQNPLLPEEPDPFAEWEGWPNYSALALGPLADEEVAVLLQDRLGGAVRPLALAVLQRQAQGNAFYADELAAAMRGAGLLVRRNDGDWYLSEQLFKILEDQQCIERESPDSPWTLAPEAVFSAEALGLPNSIQRIITARMDQLAPEAQLTLKTASVIGSPFELEIVSLAHPSYPGRAALEKQLQEMARRSLARPAAETLRPAYVFEHNLLQEGVYNSLLVEQQAALHGTVGEALEESRREAVEQLAYHYSRASARDKALRYLAQAAANARRGYANETALKYYEQALALAPDGPWEWRKAQAELLGLLGRRAEQRAALEKLSAAADAPAFEVAYQWGQFYVSVSDYDRAQEELERARHVAREHYQFVNEAASLTQLGLVAYRCGRYAPAKQWFEQAQAVFPPRTNYTSDETRPLAQSANGLGLVEYQQGNYREAGPHFQRALEFYRQAGDLRGEAQALSNLGLAAHRQHDYRLALDLHQRALEMRQTIGDRAGQGSSLLNLATAARDSGDYVQAKAWFQSALRIQRETDNRWDEVNTWNDLGILHQELGNLREAQACLQHGLGLSRLIGDEAGEAYVRLNLGLVALDREDWDEAEALWQIGLELARSQRDKPLEAMFASYLGVLSFATNRLAEGEEWSTLALTIRREGGEALRSVDDLANLALLRAARGDLAQAGVLARETLGALQACQGEGPEFPQRAYWACYSVLEARGEAAEARAALQAAYDWVMTRAARITDAALQQSFLENAPRNRLVLATARRVLGVNP